MRLSTQEIEDIRVALVMRVSRLKYSLDQAIEQRQDELKLDYIVNKIKELETLIRKIE